MLSICFLNVPIFLSYLHAFCCIFLILFPNRGGTTYKGSQWRLKEGTTQKHTHTHKAWSDSHARGPPDRKDCFHFARVFPSKSTTVYFCGKANICSGKYTGLARWHAQKIFLATLYQVLGAKRHLNYSKTLFFKPKHNNTDGLTTHEFSFWRKHNTTTAFSIVLTDITIKHMVLQYFWAKTQ